MITWLVKVGKYKIVTSSWFTYNNFFQMYNDVYERMVKAGVAKRLDEEVMLDKEGNIVTNKEEMFGRPTR
jgi:phage gp36-like protein